MNAAVERNEYRQHFHRPLPAWQAYAAGGARITRRQEILSKERILTGLFLVAALAIVLTGLMI